MKVNIVKENLLKPNKALISAFFSKVDPFSLGLLKSKNHKFRTKVTYRKLEIVSEALSNLQPEENVLARMEYVAKFLKNAITSNTYYEIGSGLEVKKEFEITS